MSKKILGITKILTLIVTLSVMFISTAFAQNYYYVLRSTKCTCKLVECRICTTTQTSCTDITNTQTPDTGTSIQSTQTLPLDYDVDSIISSMNIDSSTSNYEINSKIGESIFDLISAYRDENGYIPMERVKESSEKVYMLAKEMANKNIIEGASLHEVSNCVAFFAFKGSDYIYIPSIEDTFSNIREANRNDEEHFSVMAITSTPDVDSGVITALSRINNSYLSAKKIKSFSAYCCFQHR